MRKGSKRFIVFGAALATMLIAGVAIAAWTATGTGTGSATAGNATAITVSGSVADQLYPTGSFDFDVTVGNTNPFKVEVTQVEQNGNATSSTPGCDPAGDVTFDTQSGLTQVLEASGSAGDDFTFTFTGAVHVANTIEDGCQGASITIPVKATAASTA